MMSVFIRDMCRSFGSPPYRLPGGHVLSLWTAQRQAHVYVATAGPQAERGPWLRHVCAGKGRVTMHDCLQLVSHAA